jgi:hypothetical protein
LQTESVTYIVQRAESLCGLFYLLTLYCVIRGGASLANPPSAFRLPLSPFPFPPSPFPWFSAAVLACLLGMATKEVMVTAPLLVLLYDRTFLVGSFRQALRRRRGLYFGLAATWGLLAYLVLSTGLLGKSAGDGAPDAISGWDYLRSQPSVILHYVRLSLWPHPLCLDYGRTAIVTGLGDSLCAAILLGIPLLATTWGLVRRKAWALAGACGFLILAPSSLLPLRDVAFEHRMYMPLFSVMAITVAAPEMFGGYLRRRRIVPSPVWMAAEVCVLALVCIECGILTARRNADFRSDLTIWEDTVEKAPRNARAHYNLGMANANLLHRDLAIGEYKTALAIGPDSYIWRTNLANALLLTGKLADAIEQYRKAADIEPKSAAMRNNLGNALWLAGARRVPCPRSRGHAVRGVGRTEAGSHALAWP